MDINYLIEFLAISEKMNFSDVADQLYISQSTLSRHIQKLENELNIQLFDRSKQKLTLTPSGELILPYVVNIVKEHTKLRDAISYNSQSDNQKIVIGFTSFALTHELSRAIFGFAKKHPNISWQFIENNHNKLNELLDDAQCDFAFIRHQYNDEEDIKNHINWDRDHYVTVLPSAHPLASSPSVTLKQLENETFIITRDHRLVTDVLNQVCEKWGFRPKINTKCKTLDSVFNMIMYGEGVSVITHSEAIKLNVNKELSFLEIEPKLNLITTLHYPKDLVFTKVHKEFLDYLKQV